MDWTEDYTRDTVRLRIGDPNAYANGPTTYRITYRYERAVQDFGDVQEFFWDINGDRWFQWFPNVSATIQLTPKLSSHRTGELRCFDGNNNACQITEKHTASGSVITANADNVGPRSTMTVSVPFALGTVRDDGPAGTGPRLDVGLSIVYAIFGGLLLWMAIANVTRVRWALRGRAIVPEFLPPPGLSPAGAAEFYGRPERGISAQLLQAVIEGRIRLTSGPFGEARAKILDASTQSADPIGSTSLALILGQRQAGSAAFSVKDAFKDPTATKEYVTWRAHYLQRTKSPVGPPSTAVNRLLMLAVVGGSLAIFLATEWAHRSVWWVPTWLVLCAIGYGLQSAWVRIKDRDMLAHLEGMREYIGRADAERLAVLQSAQTADRLGPEQEIDVYEKLLPWAVALGIERTWRRHVGAQRLQALEWYDTSINNLPSSPSSLRVKGTALGLGAIAAGIVAASFESRAGGGGGGGGGGGRSSGGSSGGGSGGGGGGGGGSGW